MESAVVEYIRSEIGKTLTLLSTIRNDENLALTLEKVAAECICSLKNHGKIMFAGNGGSAADAQHMAGELVSKFSFDRAALSAIALTTDTSILTAIGNDYGYESLFARQIQAHGRIGDIFIAYSTSGKSKNILRALEEAKKSGIICVGMTGNADNKMNLICDYTINIPSAETPKIQEGHLLVGHILCGLIEKLMFEE